MSTTAQTPAPEFAIAYRNLMLDGLSNEMQTTKKVLAAVLDSNRDYRPDPKSRTAWEVAWHLASSDVQMTEEIADMKFTMEPRFKDQPQTAAALAAWYETNMRRAIDRVRAMSADQLLTPVDFYGAFNWPVIFYLAFVNNHSIHHRGQLAAYLRPMGSKVPSIYGGSADEPWQAESETTAA